MIPSVTIVDYGMGNLNSVKNAFEHAGCTAQIANDPAQILQANAVILPGVGAFGEAMENLKKLNLVEALTRRVMEDKKPFLGICLGMQLVAETSEEKGAHRGFGWIRGAVKKLKVPQNLRLPHIGWNDIRVHGNEPLFAGVETDKNFYFVHSYHLECSPENIAATCDYGGPVTAAIRRDNIWATQFHPEKSHVNGLQVLKNFLKEAAKC